MRKAGSRFIDLSHALSPEIPCWDGDCGFHLSVSCDYGQCTGLDRFRTHDVRMRAGMGTHIDAPAHCFEGAGTIEGMRLDDLISDCVVLKVDDVADEKFLVTPSIVERFERENGKIREGSFVIVYTGWDRFWSAPVKYRNDLRFPSIHEDTAKLLLERKITGLGTDTLSADALGASFPVHRSLLGAGKYLVENIAQAALLPPTGARVLILPMKIEGGTEAPVRMIATLENP